MNRIIHFEIHAKDLDKMQKFYQDVFGWEIKDLGPEMGQYRLITTGKDEQGIDGGITPREGALPQGNDPVNAFVCTISVENIDEILVKIEQAGGAVVTDKMDVPDVGTLAYRKDPEGNIFGILQPLKMD